MIKHCPNLRSFSAIIETITRPAKNKIWAAYGLMKGKLPVLEHKLLSHSVVYDDGK